MAIIRKGILGPLSGKLGPIIGGIWRGIPYIKEITKKKPKERSAAQIEAQERFGFVSTMLVPFHPYVTVGFMHEAAHKTEISAAFSRNYHDAVSGLYPDYSIVYPELIISVGKLPMLTDITMELLAEDTIKLTWEQNDIKKTTFDDQVMLILYCPELHMADGFIGGARRADKQCTYRFDPEMKGKVLQVYMSITSLDRKRIADSKYLGGLGG